MQNPIPEEELTSLLSKVKDEMRKCGFSESLIDGTNLIAVHPEYWEVSLFVPFANTKASEIRKAIEKILFSVCGVDSEYCNYCGKHNNRKAYEWFFRHPHIPQEIADIIDAEIEAEQGDEIGMGIPVPSGSKSKSDTAFLSLKDEYFNSIKSGEKTTEYRNLNSYYCDKFFSPGVKKRYVKFNRGYLSGAENQMVFEIADIVIVSDRWEEAPAVDENGNHISSFSQLPPNFAPAMYGIKLGKRVA